MRNGALVRNWPQVTLCNFGFPLNWPVLLESYRLWETLRATVLIIKIGDVCLKAKTCPKHRAKLSCCSKLASKHSAERSFCFKLARIVRKPKLVKNAVHNFPVAQNWPQITLRESRFAWNGRHFLKSKDLSKTPCATVLLLKIGPKSNCTTVVLLQIGPYC